MALQKQNIPIVFGKGLDTKSDEKVVVADKMLELENAVFTKRNSFQTRYGSQLLGKTILGTTNNLSDVKKLMTFQDELLLATKEKLYSYIPSNDAWSDRGSISAVAVSSKSVVRNTNSQSVPDSYSLKNVAVYAWEENGGISAAVYDEQSGLPIIASIKLSATGVKPKVIANNSYLYVYYIVANTLRVKRLNPLNPYYFEGEQTVASDILNNFDIMPHGNNIIFIYNTTSGTTCKAGYITTAGLIGGILTGFPAAITINKAGTDSVCLVSKFDGVFTDLIYTFQANTTDGLMCTALNLDLSTAFTVQIDPITTVIRNMTAIFLNQTTVKVYYEIFNATTYDEYIKGNTVTFGAFVDTPVSEVLSCGLASKAFAGADGSIYVVATYESPLQSSFFVMKDTLTLEKLQVASVVAKYEGGGLTAKKSSLPNVHDLKFANLVKTELQSIDGNVYSLLGVQVTSLNYDSAKLFQFKEIGKNTHIAGGILYDYDGVTAFEHGFHFFPETIPAPTKTGGAGSIEAGTRQYVFCYEWTDNQGQLHRSAPSIPISVTNALNDRNTFTVPTLRVTRRTANCGRSEIRIVGYRTKAAQTTFYRFTSQTSTYLNDTNVNTINIVDGASDVSIGANDVLYTTGGVLENFSPGSAQLVEEYRNRLIVAGLEDNSLIRYSKERVVNESMDFAEELSFRADNGRGGVQAIANLDEKLLIFKSTDIYYQIGQGPTSTGAQDDYQQPIFITTDVGTTEPQSIVNMPLGIMFKSNKGYYLLTRALEPIYIGQAVERYNSLSVTGAVLCDKFNEVRFTASDGVTLSYNYNEQQWSVFTNKEATSSVLWQNKWTILKSTAEIFVEDEGTFFDGQSPVTKKITTAWLQAANLQGAQRIYRVLFIGKLKSAHRLKIELAYDFDPSIKETFYYDTDTILGSSYYGEGYYGEESYYGGADPVYQIEIRPEIQKCQAIRFTLHDLNDDDIDGAGFELTGMTVQVGIKQGLFRPAMTKRVGPST